MTTPTGRELDVELARLMGWKWKLLPNGRVFRPADWDNSFVVRDATDADPIHANETYWYLPGYSSSLDALFGAGGPVEYARGKGMSIAVYLPGDLDDKAEFVVNLRPVVFNDSPAAALATAIYEALKEMNDGD